MDTSSTTWRWLVMFVQSYRLRFYMNSFTWLLEIALGPWSTLFVLNLRGLPLKKERKLLSTSLLWKLSLGLYKYQSSLESIHLKWFHRKENELLLYGIMFLQFSLLNKTWHLLWWIPQVSFIYILDEQSPSYDTTWEETVRGCTIKGHDFFYKYHVLKGNWLGTYLDTFLMKREKFTRAGFEPATSGLTCRRSTDWAN